MSRIKDNLSALTKKDIYTNALFILYKLADLPEYSVVSELAYILDKKSVLKLCEYFGGLTIKIPTIEEIEDVLYLLLVYQLINEEKKSFDEAFDLIAPKVYNVTKLKKQYSKLASILEDYEFTQRV